MVNVRQNSKKQPVSSVVSSALANNMESRRGTTIMRSTSSAGLDVASVIDTLDSKWAGFYFDARHAVLKAESEDGRSQRTL